MSEQPPVNMVQQTTVIQVGNPKSVLGAVLLALFLGPLGMIYATPVGALVMFVVNIIIVIPTLGLGLLLTVPLGAIWAGIAAGSHNDRLAGVSAQAVAPGASPAQPALNPQAAPAGWHDDPEGSRQLRYWDGSAWTEHYADQTGPPAVEGKDRPALGEGER